MNTWFYIAVNYLHQKLLFEVIIVCWGLLLVTWNHIIIQTRIIIRQKQLLETILSLVFDTNTWSQTTVCKLLVLDRNTWYHDCVQETKENSLLFRHFPILQNRVSWVYCQAVLRQKIACYFVIFPLFKMGVSWIYSQGIQRQLIACYLMGFHFFKMGVSSVYSQGVLRQKIACYLVISPFSKWECPRYAVRVFYDRK